MSIDKTFNSPTGFTVKQFFDGNSSDGSSFVIDSKNRIVTVGTANDGTNDRLLLARYTQAGILDTTFAGGAGYVTTLINGYDAFGTSVALDKNSNIIIAGTVTYIVNRLTYRYMFVTKYSETGIIDNTFAGGAGYIIQQFIDDTNNRANDLFIDNNNNILVTGNYDIYTESYMFIVRYTNSGVLDTANFASGIGYVIKRFKNSGTVSNSIVVDKDDSIYIGGNISTIDTSYILLAKYTDSGILDTTFNNGSGFLTKQIVNGKSATCNSLILDKDSNIYITGQAVTGIVNVNNGDQPNGISTWDVYLAKYTKSGVLDKTFANGKGVVTTTIEKYNSEGISLALDTDNNILVIGKTSVGTGNYFQSILVKYTFDGILDTNFGNGDGNGYIKIEPTNYTSNWQKKILIDNNNRILLIGYIHSGYADLLFILSRYLNIDTPATTTTTTTTTTTSTTSTTTHREPICLPLGTPINTDQGIVAIEKINPSVHTINRQRIVAITRAITPEKHFICFEKHSIAINCPKERTLMTPGHCVLYKGTLLESKHFVGRIDGVHTVPYNGRDVLYNVLMDKHNIMVVNGMALETLHPSNKVAKKILEEL